MIRTGIIVGVDAHTPQATINHMSDVLADRFPSVTFALLAGAVDSLAFPFDDGEPIDSDEPVS
jgi:hypothetical protein